MLTAERKRLLGEKATAMYQQVAALKDYLTSRGISGEMAREFGLGYCTRDIDPGFVGRLAIPYATPTGVVDIKYRIVTGEGPKYLKEPGLGTHLYNAQSVLRATTRALICEGEMDAIVAQSVTGIPAVAYPGVDTWAKQHHWPLVFDGIPDVVVLADGDEQGRKAAAAVAQSVSGRVIDLGDGEDVNTFVLKFGADELLRRLS